MRRRRRTCGQNAHCAGLALVPGSRSVATNVWCVLAYSSDGLQFGLTWFQRSVSKLPKLMYGTKQDLRAMGVTGVIVRHVGHGKLSRSGSILRLSDRKFPHAAVQDRENKGVCEADGLSRWTERVRPVVCFLTVFAHESSQTRVNIMLGSARSCTRSWTKMRGWDLFLGRRTSRLRRMYGVY
jgi:hypothetical protein